MCHSGGLNHDTFKTNKVPHGTGPSKTEGPLNQEVTVGNGKKTQLGLDGIGLLKNLSNGSSLWISAGVALFFVASLLLWVSLWVHVVCVFFFGGGPLSFLGLGSNRRFPQIQTQCQIKSDKWLSLQKATPFDFGHSRNSLNLAVSLSLSNYGVTFGQLERPNLLSGNNHSVLSLEASAF